MISRRPFRNAALLLGFFTCAVQAYPLDGYDATGIRRLEASRLAHEGEIDGPQQPSGALLGTDQVDLRLIDQPGFEMPQPDPAFGRQILELLGDDAEAYGIAVLDLSDPAHPRLAEHRADYRQNVGSVGKLVVAVAVFQALADLWPDEAARVRVLSETRIVADDFAHFDHHTVRIYDPESRTLVRRAIEDGDAASLWEYLDWMLSPSSNSAAGMVMKHAMLMRQFGEAYPPSQEEADRFFDQAAAAELTALFQRTFYEPLERNGFDTHEFRQGSFFTRVGKEKVTGPGSSHATARQLLRLGVLMEQGQLVDPFSSRELKRLLYVTERRIRYASARELNDAAVYFKSGSLYSCKAEPDFKCGKYQGNVRNYMNSFAIIESPAEGRRLHYMVMLISNVLRKNSAYDHQALAKAIQAMIESAHTEAVEGSR